MESANPGKPAGAHTREVINREADQGQDISSLNALTRGDASQPRNGGAPIAPASSAPMWDWAFYYATWGRPVFPCIEKPGQWAKAPYKNEALNLERGHLDATTDIRQVREWWTRWPNALIGSPVPRHLVCLDIDPRKSGSTLARLEKVTGELPETMAVFSGRGDGGCHLFFLRRGVLGIDRSKLRRVFGDGHGYDIKTSTGYTILPPSLHPDTHAPYYWRGEYQHPLEHPALDMPAPLSRLILEDPNKPPRPAPTGIPNLKALAGILRRVEREASERNNVVYWAAMRLVENNHPEQSYEALIETARRTSLPEYEIHKAINSARKAAA